MILSTDFERMMVEEKEYAPWSTSHVRVDPCMPSASIIQESLICPNTAATQKYPALTSTPIPRLSIHQTHPLKDSPLCFPPISTSSLRVSPSLQVYPSPRTSLAYSTTVELPALHMLRVPSQISLERCARPAHFRVSMTSLRRKKWVVRRFLEVRRDRSPDLNRGLK